MFVVIERINANAKRLCLSPPPIVILKSGAVDEGAAGTQGLVNKDVLS